MDSKTFTEIRITAAEIKKKFNIDGEIVAFCTPSKQVKKGLKDKCLLIKISRVNKHV